MPTVAELEARLAALEQCVEQHINPPKDADPKRRQLGLALQTCSGNWEHIAKTIRDQARGVDAQIYGQLQQAYRDRNLAVVAEIAASLLAGG
jgi:hypothetical protein